MPRVAARRVCALLLAGVAVALVAAPRAADVPAPLAIGAEAPDFTLPGVDGKTYSLASFAKSQVLVVMFTAVHCPTAEVYEARMKQLVAEYQPKGVAFVVIQPNSAKALRLDEMGYTDLGDSLDDMKVRAEHRQFNFPFLYDGETQEISRQYGPAATPHVFVFDKQRRLRYQGRIDSNPREAYAKVPDARNAIDAVLGGRHGGRREDPDGRLLGEVARQGDPARRRAARDREGSGAAREGRRGGRTGACGKNATDKTILVNFWATWCAPCTAEFPELQTIYRMYRKRPFDLVTVSINYPDEEKGVRKFLEAQHASSTQPAVGDDGPLRADQGLRPGVERRGAVLDGHRARRQGPDEDQRRDRPPQDATNHPGQLPRRRLRGTKRVWNQK